MAKKNQSKKHHFKHVSASEAVAAPVAPLSDASGAVAPAKSANVAGAAVTTSHDFSYVKQDLGRILILAGALVLLEVGLAYLFSHTGVGNTVYTFIKL